MNNATTFASLGVPASIVSALSRTGITTAFPIQADTLPDTLQGRDILGRGRTGSGKTLAFSIPLVARLADGVAARSGRPRGLVLAPTRELANQINDVLEPLATSQNLRTTTIYGGVNQKRQVNALRNGVDIIVACPGRLEDLIQQRYVTLEDIEITILDEADHMADLGFLPGVTRLLNLTPSHGQRMLFSATLDNGVDKLVKRFLHNEILHSVDDATSAVSTMTHHVFQVSAAEKPELVKTLASGTGKRILFTRTKHQAKKLAKRLTAQGLPAVDLHGNLSQPQRDRNLAAFSDGNVSVLVATDVAARGVHVDSVELVVHVDPPMEHKAYLHRSGRTARAGSSGNVVTVMLPEQRHDTEKLLRRAAIKVKPLVVEPESAAVTDLVGEVAPYVKPTPAAPHQGHPRNQSSRNQPSRSRSSRNRSKHHANSASTKGTTQGGGRGTVRSIVQGSAVQGSAAGNTGRRRSNSSRGTAPSQNGRLGGGANSGARAHSRRSGSAHHGTQSGR